MTFILGSISSIHTDQKKSKTILLIKAYCTNSTQKSKFMVKKSYDLTIFSLGIKITFLKPL